MEELVVTRFWMAGVMAVMLIYGAIAVAGILRNKSRDGEGVTLRETKE